MANPDLAPDAVFSSDGGPTLASLATDDSGQATNLTAGTNCVYESSSTRADLTDTRTVDFVARFNDTDTGYMFSYHTSRITLSSGGQLDVFINGSNILSHTIANITAATDEDFVISWATMPNPLTTGAGDAYVSDLHIWNDTLGTYETARTTHPAQTSPGGGGALFIWGASSTGGANAFAGSMTALRLSSACHSSIETANCYIAATSTPTLHGVDKLEFPVPTRDSGIGDDGHFVGPVLAMAAAAQRQNDMRLVGPLVNEVCVGDWAEDSAWTRANGKYVWHGEFLRRRPVPKQCNRLIFRAHVQQNAASAQDFDIRFISSNRPGIKSVDGSPPVSETYFGDVTRNADDGTGTTGGAWVESGPVRIALDEYGYTYLWIALDGSSLTDYRIRAWSVEPIYLDDPGGFGGGGGFG